MSNKATRQERTRAQRDRDDANNSLRFWERQRAKDPDQSPANQATYDRARARNVQAAADAQRRLDRNEDRQR